MQPYGYLSSARSRPGTSMPGMRDSATLTCAVPGANGEITSRSTVSSRDGSSWETVSTAVGVCAARTWMSHSRRTAKLPGPLTATATLPKPTSPALSGQVSSSRWLASSCLVSDDRPLERDRAGRLQRRPCSRRPGRRRCAATAPRGRVSLGARKRGRITSAVTASRTNMPLLGRADLASCRRRPPSA